MGKSGDSLCSPTSTTKGMECRLAASATICIPTGHTTPPFASTACAPTSTCTGGKERQVLLGIQQVHSGNVDCTAAATADNSNRTSRRIRFL